MVDPVRMGPVSGLMPASPRKGEAQPAAPANAAPASVPLSRLLMLAQDLAEAGPPVDEVKVAQVRRAIADGSYAVDPGALARAILRFGAGA